ncbi:MAG: ferredoxin [Candidatus Dormibacteria bacterium]
MSVTAGNPPPLRVIVDRRLCTGNGACLRAAPGVFELDPEGKALVRNAGAAPEELVREAARACPTGAIILLDLRF